VGNSQYPISTKKKAGGMVVPTYYPSDSGKNKNRGIVVQANLAESETLSPKHLEQKGLKMWLKCKSTCLVSVKQTPITKKNKVKK
jgi:hypothetical protein